MTGNSFSWVIACVGMSSSKKEERLRHLVPAPAVRLMKRRVQSRPGLRQENRFPGLGSTILSFLSDVWFIRRLSERCRKLTIASQGNETIVWSWTAFRWVSFHLKRLKERLRPNEGISRVGMFQRSLTSQGLEHLVCSLITAKPRQENVSRWLFFDPQLLFLRMSRKWICGQPSAIFSWVLDFCLYFPLDVKEIRTRTSSSGQLLRQEDVFQRLDR